MKVNLASNEKSPRSKFNASPSYSDGIRFASRAECDYYNKLKEDVKNGDISFFLMQVPFYIPGGITYKLDFLVFKKDGTIECIDVKGYETPEFKLKKKLVEHFYPIKISIYKQTRKK